ncbi:hypothetical protein SUGI_1004560 [Cryptomeria japonica]|nr:hypothetical protein SUGI_1004560 [Cryptomeria japonica]
MSAYDKSAFALTNRHHHMFPTWKWEWRYGNRIVPSGAAVTVFNFHGGWRELDRVENWTRTVVFFQLLVAFRSHGNFNGGFDYMRIGVVRLFFDLIQMSPSFGTQICCQVPVFQSI